MSRSFKKHPGGGFCCIAIGAQKAYRSQENRAKRREVKIRLLLDQDMPHDKEYGNEWSSPRDGKQYWINYDKEWMRK